jgi:hypothetical protein
MSQVPDTHFVEGRRWREAFNHDDPCVNTTILVSIPRSLSQYHDTLSQCHDTFFNAGSGGSSPWSSRTPICTPMRWCSAKSCGPAPRGSSCRPFLAGGAVHSGRLGGAGGPCQPPRVQPLPPGVAPQLERAWLASQPDCRTGRRSLSPVAAEARLALAGGNFAAPCVRCLGGADTWRAADARGRPRGGHGRVPERARAPGRAAALPAPVALPVRAVSAGQLSRDADLHRRNHLCIVHRALARVACGPPGDALLGGAFQRGDFPGALLGPATSAPLCHALQQGASGQGRGGRITRERGGGSCLR